GFQVIVGQEVTDIFAAVIVGRDALDMLARSFAAMTMTWQQMQRAKLVDAQTPAAGGPLPIQTAKGPVFPDKQGVGGFLPSLGPPQPYLVTTQDFAQPANTDVGHDFLFDQILPQFGQRPLRHADERDRRRQSDFRDL